MKCWMARKLYEHDDDSKLPYASTLVVIADEHQAEIERLNIVVAHQQQAIEAIFAITEERLVDWGAVRKIKNDYRKITAKHKQEKE